MLSGRFQTETSPSTSVEEITSENKLLHQQNKLLKAHLKAAYCEIGQLKVELIQATVQNHYATMETGDKRQFSTPEDK